MDSPPVHALVPAACDGGRDYRNDWHQLASPPRDVNGARLERNGKALAIYGDPREKPVSADMVLFTHHRGDVAWAGRALVAAGAKAVVPAGELADYTEVNTFWSDFVQKRFHDYAHKSTKVLGEPIAAAKTVRGGDALTWEGMSIRVI